VRIPSFTLALVLLLIPASPHGQVFRSSIDLVSFGVTVLDRKGALVSDLDARDFQIWEDGKKQEVQFFVRGDQSAVAPELHLGLLFDTSGSMDEDIALSRTAAVKFLNALPEAVDVTLVDFDTEVRIARYGQNDYARLVERIRRRRPDGMTAFYDALAVYLHGASQQEGRKILVVYTDGGDNTSSITFPDLLDLIKASDVTLYAVGFLGHQASSYQFDARTTLQRLTDPAGGLAFFPTGVRDIESAYEKVLAEVKAQYTIGYLSSNTRTDGSWREVQIKVTRPGLKTRTRQGYFAPYRKRP